ncbi:NIPSNAP family protein [Oxalobacteraceae bacterium OM1]|nr:NIPSNAP family protein [Oxalobacteraceae bacterium OM1]
MQRLIEIRSYKLMPDTAAAFHDIMSNKAVPMLQEWHTDVVAYGPSAHEPDSYFLIRAYNDLADLNAQQEAFYGSDAWRQGPRVELLACIETYLNTVVWLGPEAIEDMRRRNAS